MFQVFASVWRWFHSFWHGIAFTCSRIFTCTAERSAGGEVILLWKKCWCGSAARVCCTQTKPTALHQKWREFPARLFRTNRIIAFCKYFSILFLNFLAFLSFTWVGLNLHQRHRLSEHACLYLIMDDKRGLIKVLLWELIGGSEVITKWKWIFSLDFFHPLFLRQHSHHVATHNLITARTENSIICLRQIVKKEKKLN